MGPVSSPTTLLVITLYCNFKLSPPRSCIGFTELIESEPYRGQRFYKNKNTFFRVTGYRFFMGYPYLKNCTSQRVLLGHKLFADIEFPEGLGKFLQPEVQVGQNWPLYSQRWPKFKIHVRDSILRYKLLWVAPWPLLQNN